MNKQGAKKEPGFFKYIVPLACTHRLRLPPAHHWNKDKKFADKVTLRDRSGNTWPVKVENVENQVCFVDGWLEFVKDNRVKEKDFVVFENVSPNVYSFLLLDSITKRETGGFTRLRSEDKDSESEEQSVGGFEVREESEEKDAEEVEEEDEDLEEDDDLEEEEEDNVLRGNSSSRIGPDDRMPQRRRTNSPIRSTTDMYEHELFESGAIPRPTNPYFITRRRVNRNDQLYVPRNFVRDYNLHVQIKTVMRDSGGTEWATELTEWSDGRRWYYGGWGSFCRKNHVRVGDYCVCEFVEEAGKGLILFVYKLE